MNGVNVRAGRKRRRLIGLLKHVGNLTQGEAEACLRGIEPEAVARLGGWQATIRRVWPHRHRYQQHIRAK